MSNAATQPAAADVDWAHLLATQILGEFRRLLGPAVFGSLSVADRQLLADIAADAAALQLVAVTANLQPAEAARQLSQDKADIAAQFANIAAIAEINGAKLFWDAFQKVAEKAAGLLVFAAVAAV